MHACFVKRCIITVPADICPGGNEYHSRNTQKEFRMPHLNLKLYPGRTPEMKENLAKAIRKALSEESGVWKPEDISVSVEEIPAEEFESVTKASFKEDELLLDSKYINYRK